MATEAQGWMIEDTIWFGIMIAIVVGAAYFAI